MSVELFYRRLGKLYETAIISEQTDFAGADIQTFKVITGSRMIQFLNIHSITGGATVTVTVENGTDKDKEFLLLSTTNYTTSGIQSLIFSDIHIYFIVTITVTGGSATYSLGCTLADNKADKVQITDADGDNLDINPDGSININIVTSTVGSSLNIFNEVTGVASGTETDVVLYTVPVGKTAELIRIEFSGDQISLYQIYINAVKKANRRTHHGSGLSGEFEFLGKGAAGVLLVAGDVVKLTSLHGRPASGSFEGRVQVFESP